MKAIAGAIVVLGGSVLSAGGAIAQAIPKISNAIPPAGANYASFIGFAIIFLGAVVMGIGFRSKTDQTQLTRTE